MTLRRKCTERTGCRRALRVSIVAMMLFHCAIQLDRSDIFRAEESAFQESRETAVAQAELAATFAEERVFVQRYLLECGHVSSCLEAPIL